MIFSVVPFIQGTLLNQGEKKPNNNPPVMINPFGDRSSKHELKWHNSKEYLKAGFIL